MKLLDLTFFLSTATLALAGPNPSGGALEARAGECPGWTYSKMMLTAHNNHRANHSVTALVYNSTLANAAAVTAVNGVIGAHDKYVQFSGLPEQTFAQVLRANLSLYQLAMERAGDRTFITRNTAMLPHPSYSQRQPCHGSTMVNSHTMASMALHRFSRVVNGSPSLNHHTTHTSLR